MQASLQTEYRFTLTVERSENQGNSVPTLLVRVTSDVPTTMSEKFVRMLVRRPEVEQWLREQLIDLALSPHIKWEQFPMDLRWIRATPVHKTPFMLVQLFGANDAQDAANLAHTLKIKVY